MIINVFSLKEANEKILSNTEYQKNWISIRDKDYPELYKYIRAACVNVLVLEFDDVTQYGVKHSLIHPLVESAAKNKRDYIFFNNQMARQVINFASDVYKRKETLNIHCYAGRSRSQAIGYTLNIYFNLFLENNEEHFFRNLAVTNDKFMPNADVLKIMNKELFIGGEYEYFE